MNDFDLKDVSEIVLSEIKYHWHDRIPEGQIVTVAGRPSGGKSTVVCDIIADYSRNGHNVILSNQEDGESPIKARLLAAGVDITANKPGVGRVKVIDQGNGYRFPDDIGLLGLHILTQGIKLCVFDAAAQHLIPTMSNDQGVRSALSPLAKLAEQTGCTMLFITHVTKHVSKNAYPLTAVGGSGGGLPGASRMVFFVGVNPGDSGERACVWVKDQYRELPKALTFEAEAYTVLDEDSKVEANTVRLILTADDADIDPMGLLAGKAFEDSNSGPTSDKRAMAAEWLTIYLSTGKQPNKQLRDDAAKSGLAWATIRRAKDDVGIESYRVGFGKGSEVFWALPDGHPALVESEQGMGADGEAVEVSSDFIGPLRENESRSLDTETAEDETLTDEDIAALLNPTTED